MKKIMIKLNRGDLTMKISVFDNYIMYMYSH